MGPNEDTYGAPGTPTRRGERGERGRGGEVRWGEVWCGVVWCGGGMVWEVGCVWCVRGVCVVVLTVKLMSYLCR